MRKKLVYVLGIMALTGALLFGMKANISTVTAGSVGAGPLPVCDPSNKPPCPK